MGLFNDLLNGAENLVGLPLQLASGIYSTVSSRLDGSSNSNGSTPITKATPLPSRNDVVNQVLQQQLDAIKRNRQGLGLNTLGPTTAPTVSATLFGQ